jgi:cysteinyl-tRNA synthetase, unknown class
MTVRSRLLPRLTFRPFELVTVAASWLFTFTVCAVAQQAALSNIALKSVDSWGYQLQNVVPRIVAKDGFDVLVVDYSRDGTDGGALSVDDVAILRKRQGQPNRLILAYLSIGEAENYRYYWQASWTEKSAVPVKRPLVKGFVGSSDGIALGVPERVAPLDKLTAAAPRWLSEENPEWRGNYLVRYWDNDWQALIFGSPGAYLDKILAAGFDGVYLDKIDANDDWQPTRPTAERDMVDFVKKLAAYARQRRPAFLIVPQNAEELLEYSDYVLTIDAIAKEDLLTGGAQRKDGVPNPETEILKSKRHLDKALRAGRRVMVVEYLDQLDAIVRARRRLLGYKYIPFFARRALDEVPRALSTSDAQK